MFNTSGFALDCARIRQQSPLILNLTNIVAAGFTADVLLVTGASPLMSCEGDEVEELAAAAGALVINCGSVYRTQAEAMAGAAAAAARLGKPWILDPAGAGASRFRAETVRELIRRHCPSVIRGNASEILFLSGEKCSQKGVDSTVGSTDALDAAVSLSRSTGAVISLSGATDYVTDGNSIVCIHNGHPMMARASAMGCAASAITGAFLAVNPNCLDAAAGAAALAAVSGEIAAGACKGPGSLKPCFLDTLFNLDIPKAKEIIRYEERTA